MPKCPVCGKFIKGNSALTTHIKFKHPDYWEKMKQYKAVLSELARPKDELKQSLLEILAKDNDFASQFAELLGVPSVSTDVNDLRVQLTQLQEDFKSLKEDFESLKKEFSELEFGFTVLAKDLRNYSTLQGHVQNRLSSLEQRIDKLEKDYQEGLTKLSKEIKSLKDDLMLAITERQLAEELSKELFRRR